MKPMKKTKVGAATLAALMIAGGVASCANNGDSTDTTTPSTDTTQSASKGLSSDNGDKKQSSENAKDRISQSGSDDEETAKTAADGTSTITQTLSDEEAAALDAQGLRGGVISRGDGYIVTRDGNTLTITVGDSASTGGSTGGTVVNASDVNKPETPTTPTTPDSGDGTGGSVIDPGTGTGGSTGGGSIIDPGTTDPGAGSGSGSGTTDPGTTDPGTGGSGGTTDPGTGGSTGSGTTDPGSGSGSSTTTPSETTFDTQASKFLQTVQSKLFDLINQERAKAGVPPLQASVQLTNSAQTWATYAAQNGQFGIHYNDWRYDVNGGTALSGVGDFMTELAPYEDGLDTSARLGAGRNTADAAAASMMDAINSESQHHDAILATNIDRVGIGIALGLSDDLIDDGTGNLKEVKSPTIQTIIQTGRSTAASEVGADDATTTYANPNQQTFVDDPSGSYKAAAPQVIAPEPNTPTEETTAPVESTPAETTPVATEPVTETPAPAAEETAPTPVEAPATETVAPDPAPSTETAPAADTAAAEAPVANSGVALAAGE